MNDSTRNPADYARMAPAQPSTVADFLPSPRPISITSCCTDWVVTSVLYDDGTVWQWTEHDKTWTRLPPIPTGDRP